MSQQPENPPAFPQTGSSTWNIRPEVGMDLRDYFAAHAPFPNADRIASEMSMDRARNPHNDYHRPKLRSECEIIAELAYRHADAMLAHRAKAGGSS